MSLPPNEELAETLSCVAPKQWRSTSDIYYRGTVTFVTQGAISNRLQKLRAMKLVQCQRRGKEKFWRRA